jgi:hypothetical protein
MAPPRLRFAVLCVLTYLFLAWVARFDMGTSPHVASLVYPLDTFSMYAGVPSHDVSHLLLRDRAGSTHDVTAFRTFDCADPVLGLGTRCTAGNHIPYHYDDLTHYIASHPGAGDMEVELIARTWHIPTGGAAVETADCVVTRCRVGR